MAVKTSLENRNACVMRVIISVNDSPFTQTSLYGIISILEIFSFVNDERLMDDEPEWVDCHKHVSTYCAVHSR